MAIVKGKHACDVAHGYPRVRSGKHIQAASLKPAVAKWGMEMGSSALRWFWLAFGGVGLVLWGVQSKPPATAPGPSASARASARVSSTSNLQSSGRTVSLDLNAINMPAIAPHESRTGVLSPGFYFDQAVPYWTTEYEEPLAVAIGDISGDGRSDVVATVSNNWTDSAVLIYRQSEDGILLAPDRYPYRGRSQIGALSIVDLDNDGDQDIAIGHDRGLALLLNGPEGMSIQTIQQAYVYSRVVPLDVDGDGFKDIAAVDLEYGTDIYVNNGAGILTKGQHVPTPLALKEVSVADLTNDGADDLVVQYKAELLVYPAGSGVLGAPIKLAYPIAGTAPLSHGFADFNGDGRLDVAMNDARDPRWENQSYVRVYLRTAEGSLAGGWARPTAYFPGGLAIADLDGNGRYDLVSMDLTPSYGMSYFLQGAKGFGAELKMTRRPYSQYANNQLAVGNVFGDDCQDIVVVILDTPGYAISVYPGRNCSHYPIRTQAPPLSIPPRR